MLSFQVRNTRAELASLHQWRKFRKSEREVSWEKVPRGRDRMVTLKELVCLFMPCVVMIIRLALVRFSWRRVLGATALF
jgi:hypothetical protein